MTTGWVENKVDSLPLPCTRQDKLWFKKDGFIFLNPPTSNQVIEHMINVLKLKLNYFDNIQVWFLV